MILNCPMWVLRTELVLLQEKFLVSSLQPQKQLFLNSYSLLVRFFFMNRNYVDFTVLAYPLRSSSQTSAHQSRFVVVVVVTLMGPILNVSCVWYQ